MNSLWRDIVYGFRFLIKQPGFTIGAALTLALGIGANSAIFNIVSAFILRPLPGASEPERLVVPFQVDRNGETSDSYSYPDFIDYRNRSKTLDGLLAFRLVQVVLGTGDTNDVIYGELVSGNYFDVLGVKPQQGRSFNPDEDKTPNSHPVIVISHDLWQKRFAGDPEITRKEITLNGTRFSIIGVAPEDFQGTKWGLGMDFWAPMMMQQRIIPGDLRLDRRDWDWFQVLGRLKKGVSILQAEADLTAVSSQLEREFQPGRTEFTRIRVLPETEGRFDQAGNVIKLGSGMAMAIVGVILLIVCANLTNLLLAKAGKRQKEIGIRLAMGASRIRLIRQLITESVILALIGGALGLLFSYWVSDFLRIFAPVLPYRMVLDLSPDLMVVLFTLIVSMATGIIFGLAPAMHVSNPNLVTVLKGEGSDGVERKGRLNLRKALVITQVTLSLVVLVCGGLMIKSFQNAKKINPGFKTDGVVAMTITPGLLGYDDMRGQEFYRQLLAEMNEVPGVEAASMADILPLGDSSNSSGPVYPDGEPVPPPGEGLNVLLNTVSPGYFLTMRTRLLKGREFDDSEIRGEISETVINETLAKRLWPNADPIGRMFRIAGGNTKYQVIGVVEDGKYRTLGESARPHMWFSSLNSYMTEMTLLLRTDGDPSALVGSVREVVRRLDSRVPLSGIKTMKQHMTIALWGTQMGAGTAVAFGIITLLLSAMGIYSVISYSVSQRTKEIGIRMALGANQRNVVRLVASEGQRVALLGVVIGLPLALALSTALAGLLFGVSTYDPIIFIGIALLLFIVGSLAGRLPAHRAARVDPMVALRYE